MEYFDDYLKKQVEDLSVKYMRIDDLFKNIALVVFGSELNIDPNNPAESQKLLKVPKMTHYYYYWERRVYNALVKMVLRALLGLKSLFQ